MAQQQTLAMAAGFEKHVKRTRRAEFLAQMELAVPW
ncbi:MAG TPA: IS5/IS1182 family transposase, partial [Acidobacteriaceae bacterium]